MSRAAASFGILLCLLLLVAAVNCSDQGNCSTTCIVEQCDSKINLSISLISWVDAKIDLINLGMFDKISDRNQIRQVLRGRVLGLCWRETMWWSWCLLHGPWQLRWQIRYFPHFPICPNPFYTSNLFISIF